MASPSEPAECRLLDLAPELRNRIYEYVLCEDDYIKITQHNWMQPALLQTCKTIRSEATSVYYRDNTFAFPAENFDSTIMQNFWRHTSHFYNDSKLATYVSHVNSKAWPNFLRWLKAYFDARLPQYLSYDVAENGVHFSTAAKAFDIVYDLRNAGTTWNTIKKVLESYKVLTADLMQWDTDREDAFELGLIIDCAAGIWDAMGIEMSQLKHQGEAEEMVFIKRLRMTLRAFVSKAERSKRQPLASVFHWPHIQQIAEHENHLKGAEHVLKANMEVVAASTLPSKNVLVTLLQVVHIGLALYPALYRTGELADLVVQSDTRAFRAHRNIVFELVPVLQESCIVTPEGPFPFLVRIPASETVVEIILRHLYQLEVHLPFEGLASIPNAIQAGHLACRDATKDTFYDAVDGLIACQEYGIHELSDRFQRAVLGCFLFAKESSADLDFMTHLAFDFPIAMLERRLDARQRSGITEKLCFFALINMAFEFDPDGASGEPRTWRITQYGKDLQLAAEYCNEICYHRGLCRRAPGLGYDLRQMRQFLVKCADSLEYDVTEDEVEDIIDFEMMRRKFEAAHRHQRQMA